MPHQRKTHDCWEIQVNYGDGFATESVETNYYGMLINKRAYRENCGAQFRVVSKRYKKTELSAWEMSRGAYYKSMLEWFGDKLKREPKSEHVDKWLKKWKMAKDMYVSLGENDPNRQRAMEKLGMTKELATA